MSRADKITAIQVGLQVFSTHAYLFQQQVAEKMQLHPTDFYSIHLLDTWGPMTAGQLTKYLGLTSGATTAVIDRLVALGYAERSASVSDRRSIIIRLRADGAQKIKREYSHIDTQVQDRLKRFTNVELDIIKRFLQMLAEF